MMTNRPQAEAELQAWIERETLAWDERDAAARVEIFHPDRLDDSGSGTGGM